MRNKKEVKRSVATVMMLLTALWMSSCGGGGTTTSGPAPTEVDGGASNATISIRASDSVTNTSLNKQTLPDATDSAGGIVTVTAASVAVDKVEFEAISGRTCADISEEMSGCSCIDQASSSIARSSSEEVQAVDVSDDNEVHVSGPIVVDLIAGTSVPAMDSLLIPSGVYHEIQLKLAPLDQFSTLVTAGNPLLGNTLVIEGTYVTDLGSQLFRLVLNFDHEIQFESDAGIDITESAQVNALILSLDMNAWFTGIDLAACFASGAVSPDADGVIVIDPTVVNAACQFTDAILSNIEAATQLSEDES